MTDRALAATISERLGPDALRRLRSLRRRLWLRRSLRVATISGAAGIAGIALVQLAARTVALEIAPWLMAAVAAAAAVVWAVVSWRLRPSLTDAARGAGDERGPACQIEHGSPQELSAGSAASISAGVPRLLASSALSMRLTRPASTLPEPIS